MKCERCHRPLSRTSAAGSKTRNVLDYETANRLFRIDAETGAVVRRVKTGVSTASGRGLSGANVEIDGRSYCVKKVAWLLLYGTYPLTPVVALDGNPLNAKPENLMLAKRLSREHELIDCLEDVKRVLAYEPESGLFVWRAWAGKKSVPGEIAGWAHSQGYTAISLFGLKVYAHRLAFLFQLGRFPDDVVDHINGNRKDNRWSNLRDVNQRTNVENRTSPLSANSASGLLGVHWCSQQNKWQAEIKSFGRKKHIGFFDDPFKAHEAYLQAKRKMHAGCTL
jgi:hypothetical protein